jgi:hypothetical protein
VVVCGMDLRAQMSADRGEKVIRGRHEERE